MSSACLSSSAVLLDAVSGTPALAYAEQLSCALIQHLGDAGGAVDGSTPVVAALSDDLLASLLAAFPALYHSRPCYSALLTQLQYEEGDVPMGQVDGCGVWLFLLLGWAML